MNKKHYFFLIGILAVHFLFLSVLKFTAWPEMLLWPYLITKGWLPYANIAIAHNPLMLFDLSVFFWIFGAGILQLKIFTWALILSFDVLVFVIVKKLWNIKTAFLALISFAVWNLFYDGNGLWFDLYMGVFAFCSFYFVKQKKWIWSGIFWALAFISKQTAIWFLLPIGYALAQESKLRLESFKKLTVGVILIAIPFVLIMLLTGIFPSFWNWAVRFGVFTLPGSRGQIQLPDLKNLAVAVLPFSVFLFTNRKSGFPGLALWAIAGALGAYPRFEFFHLQPAVPFLAIAVALAFNNSKGKAGGKVKLTRSLAIFYILGSIYLFAGFFMRNFKEGVRFYEQDVKDVASFVNYNTSPGDKILVLNWWDSLYVLTDTLPAFDPWVPHLSWYMEEPGIQEKMVESLKTNSPKLIVLNPYTDFGLSAYIPEKVYNYVIENYRIFQKVDGVEILMQKDR